jgi:inorganic triphosphatase YgiF
VPQQWRAPVLRGATPAAAFRAVADSALVQIEANARGVLVADDPDFLHQLRVGMRRLRAALRAFRAILARKDVRRVTQALRKVTPKLGAARDWDVLVARLEAAHAPVRLLEKAHSRRKARRRDAPRVACSSPGGSPASVRPCAAWKPARAAPASPSSARRRLPAPIAS